MSLEMVERRAMAKVFNKLALTAGEHQASNEENSSLELRYKSHTIQNPYI